MQPIIYDVAVSADGFICGADADVSAFPHAGPVVDAYRTRLAGYGAVLMGRATYTFAYDHGLPPGANPYPGLKAVILSNTLTLLGEDVSVWRDLAPLAELRRRAQGPIYLCGGGALAGCLLAAGEIDQVVLKRAPILLATGVPLWGHAQAPTTAKLIGHDDHGDGIVTQRYALGAH